MGRPRALMRCTVGAAVLASAILGGPVLGQALNAQTTARSVEDRLVTPMCIGVCPRVVGLRLAWRDREVRRVDGISVTVWTPYVEGQGKINGLALGLPITGQGSVDGAAVGLVAAQTTDRLRGISLGGLAVGADRGVGILSGGLLALSGQLSGISVSGVASIATVALNGVAIGGLVTSVSGGWGATVSGVGAYAGGGFRGIVLSGVGAMTGEVGGVVLSPVHRAQRFTGVSIAVVNYARSLRGIQLGALNIVADGRSPRFLPLINWR